MKFDFNFEIGTLKSGGNTLKGVTVNTTVETTPQELTELLASHDKMAEMVIPKLLELAEQLVDKKK